jgi:TPR repeat protein
MIAADHGDSDAMNRLGIIHVEGWGIAPDRLAAHMWFDLAARHGQADAPGNLARLSREMSPDDIEKAKRMAADWLTGQRRRARK